MQHTDNDGRTRERILCIVSVCFNRNDCRLIRCVATFDDVIGWGIRIARAHIPAGRQNSNRKRHPTGSKPEGYARCVQNDRIANFGMAYCRGVGSERSRCAVVVIRNALRNSRCVESDLGDGCNAAGGCWHRS